MRTCFFRALLFFFLFSFLVCTAALPVSAEETASTEMIPIEFTGLLEALPAHVRDLLPDALYEREPQAVFDAVMGMSDLSYVTDVLSSLLGLGIEKNLHLLCSVAGILILSALCKALEATLRASVSRAFSTCVTWAMLALLLGEGYTVIADVTAYFSSLASVTAASVPLLGALYAIGGNVSAAATSAAGLSVFLSVLEGVIAKTVVPFCGICLAFSLVNALDPALRVTSLVSTLKKNYTTVLTFLMMLLLTLLSSQTVLASRADTLAMKSAKFAAGNLFPVLGGSVSELLRSVGAGVGYLRGTVGICAILLLLLLLLPPVIELLLLRMTWQLCASFAELLGCDVERKLLDELASVGGYLLTAACVSASVPILSFVLLASSASAI